MKRRRRSDQARAQRIRMLRNALPSLGVQTRDDHLEPERGPLADRHNTPGSIAAQHVEPDRNEGTGHDTETRVGADPRYGAGPNVELTTALDRIADTIDRLCTQLDASHHEHVEDLDAIEFLGREILIGTIITSASRSVVLGGVIDPSIIDLTPAQNASLGSPLTVDAPVEVRSRFGDRWVRGFAITETVATEHGYRYRLSRQSDGHPLPILFDAADVRAHTLPRHPADSQLPDRPGA